LKPLIPVIRLPAAFLAAALALWLGQVTPVTAGYDEGAAAFIRGDYELAWQEWLSLGERGHQSAQYNLGVLYSIGLGVEQDDEEAAKWFRRAADRGLPAAQMRLGTAYLEGKGVSEDLKEAYFWFSLAATHFSLGEQHEQAVAARESTGAGLSRAQITEVLERAMDWRPVPQTIDQSEKERLIAAPADEEPAALRGGEPNGMGAGGSGSESSPSPTMVVKGAAAAEASDLGEPVRKPEPPAAQVAAVTDTPANAAQSVDDAPQRQEGAGQKPSDLSSAAAVSDGTGTLETSASGLEPAREAESAPEEAEDMSMQLAAATGGPQAEQASETPDSAARESFAAHLSSVRSRDGTETEWQKLQSQFPGLLADKTLTVRRIDLAEQGTFYRVMAGPFSDFDAAKEICTQLKASDQYCAVLTLDEGSAQ